MVISELGLRGLWLQLLGCSQLRFWVKLQVDSCCLVWLDAGWKVFSLCLGLQAEDNVCCRFNGGDTLFVRCFDADGNRISFDWENSANGGSGGLDGSSSSLPSSPRVLPATTPSAGSLAGTTSSAGSLAGGVCSSSSEQDADVKQVSKKASR